MRVFGQRIAGIIKKVIKQMSRNGQTRVESKLRKPKTVEIAYSDESQDRKIREEAGLGVAGDRKSLEMSEVEKWSRNYKIRVISKVRNRILA